MKRFCIFFSLAIFGFTHNHLSAVSPCELLSSRVAPHIPVVSGEEILAIALELWSLFDLLKAIRFTEREGVLVAQELVGPLSGFAALVASSMPHVGSALHSDLCQVMREVIDAFEMAFEPAITRDTFVIEALLGHIMSVCSSKSPAVFNNAVSAGNVRVENSFAI